nr:MAG TPA: hypothetical protein [Caudoviricetes sp.]
MANIDKESLKFILGLIKKSEDAKEKQLNQAFTEHKKEYDKVLKNLFREIAGDIPRERIGLDGTYAGFDPLSKEAAFSRMHDRFEGLSGLVGLTGNHDNNLVSFLENLVGRVKNLESRPNSGSGNGSNPSTPVPTPTPQPQNPGNLLKKVQWNGVSKKLESVKHDGSTENVASQSDLLSGTNFVQDIDFNKTTKKFEILKYDGTKSYISREDVLEGLNLSVPTPPSTPTPSGNPIKDLKFNKGTGKFEITKLDGSKEYINKTDIIDAINIEKIEDSYVSSLLGKLDPQTYAGSVVPTAGADKLVNQDAFNALVVNIRGALLNAYNKAVEKSTEKIEEAVYEKVLKKITGPVSSLSSNKLADALTKLDQKVDSIASTLGLSGTGHTLLEVLDKASKTKVHLQGYQIAAVTSYKYEAATTPSLTYSGLFGNKISPTDPKKDTEVPSRPASDGTYLCYLLEKGVGTYDYDVVYTKLATSAEEAEELTREDVKRMWENAMKKAQGLP